MERFREEARGHRKQRDEKISEPSGKMETMDKKLEIRENGLRIKVIHQRRWRNSGEK